MKVLAIDIGASSGRHILTWPEDGQLKTREIYRFPNRQKTEGGRLCWDIDQLFRDVVAGMKACKEAGMIPDSVGIDTWGVDFVLLDKNMVRLDEVVCYRDQRTAGMDRSVETIIPFPELYGRTGIQKQPFNTLYQLRALQTVQPDVLRKAAHLMFVPDYLHYLLCGSTVQEYTVASTSGLLDVHQRRWDSELIRMLGLPERLFTSLKEPGTRIGTLLASVQCEAGYNCEVILPASHDTGSAFTAAFLRKENSAILSSGTWSLLGLEINQPLTNPAALAANFSNEGGTGGKIRFLQNIMGLWMLQSIRKESDLKYSFPELAELARNSKYNGIIDVNQKIFLAPAHMSSAVADACQATGFKPPEKLGDTVRCVYLSLADSYRTSAKNLVSITGQTCNSIQIVGGGSQDHFLNQLTANSTGLPVYAGPIEATVLGNSLVQLTSLGVFGSLDKAGQFLSQSEILNKYLPQEV